VRLLVIRRNSHLAHCVLLLPTFLKSTSVSINYFCSIYSRMHRGNSAERTNGQHTQMVRADLAPQNPSRRPKVYSSRSSDILHGTSRLHCSSHPKADGSARRTLAPSYLTHRSPEQSIYRRAGWYTRSAGRWLACPIPTSRAASRARTE
jgi:hypothetical protein